VNPGQTVFKQGDWADDFYLIRLGHVKITISRFGAEGAVIWRGPGNVLGEIGLMALGQEDSVRTLAQVEREVLGALDAAPDEELSSALPAGRRTATCLALDNLELARIRRGDFLLMIKRFPTVRRRLLESSIKRLKDDSGDVAEQTLSRRYIELGLYQAQNLLALDMTRCTHCDECTKACIDQHGSESHGVPLTRLLRDGVRFGQHLVATSCRSCRDAYCMAGCPVDAIHRGKHQQIVIEDHCIGCGLCADNCPFGNIWMVPNERRKLEVPDPENPQGTKTIAQPKAATCDLCDAEGELDAPMPRCVHACPHDAAHRMTGQQLLDRVTRAGLGV
jgi:Fe-S-cluster-containing hydrogenase component 2